MYIVLVENKIFITKEVYYNENAVFFDSYIEMKTNIEGKSFIMFPTIKEAVNLYKHIKKTTGAVSYNRNNCYVIKL